MFKPNPFSGHCTSFGSGPTCARTGSVIKLADIVRSFYTLLFSPLRLLDSELKTDDSKNTGAMGSMFPLTPDADFLGDSDEHISQLIEERDSLLRTGVYSSDDPIIGELDRRIREAIGQKENSGRR